MSLSHPFEPILTPSPSYVGWSQIFSFSTGNDDLVYKAILLLTMMSVLYIHLSTAPQSKKVARPVVVPSWIPWLGSAITMGMDPDGFLIRNARKYGPAFFVDVIGVRFLYITARDPIKWALKRHKDISIRGVEYDSLQAIFGLSKDAAVAETTHGIAFKTLSRDIQKWSVQETVVAFRDVFNDAVQEFQQQLTPTERNDGKTIRFSEVFLPLIYRAFSRSALGLAYPGETMWKEHNEFHDAFPVLFSGLPSSWVQGGIKARMRLSAHVYDLLEKHVNTPNPTSDSAPLFMKIMSKVMAAQSDMDMQDAAKMVNLYMFAGDNVGLGTFWILSRALAHPGLYRKLRDEADRVWQQYRQRHPTITASNGETRDSVFGDMLGDLSVIDKDLPLLNSVFKEMLRWHGKQMFVRRAEIDFLLPITGSGSVVAPESHLSVKKGDNIILYMRPTHFDPEVFHEPHVFKPERFAASEGKEAGEIDESKNGFMLPFGFGSTVCPGRYLASFEIKTAFLILLQTFDIEYVGVTGPMKFLAHRGPNMDKSIPRQNLATFGTPLSMPFGDLKVRMNPRKHTI